MVRSKYIYLFVFAFFFVLFGLVKQAKAVEIKYKSNYGKAQVGFGFLVGSLDTQKVQDLLYYFGFDGGKEIFFKIKDPAIPFLNSSEFQTLSANRFKWYFYFSNNSDVSSFLSTYFQKTNQEVVVELKSTDPGFMQGLKQQFPQVKIHAGNFNIWPRNEVKTLVQQTSPTYLDAVSIRIDESLFESDLFASLKDLYDVFYDASMDISGLSGIKINFPPSSKLALSDIEFPDYTSTRAMASINGAIADLVVSSVSTQKKTPFKYMIAGDFFRYSSSEKKVLGTIASVLHEKPDIYWPLAIEQNGDPFDNSFFSESNTKPVIGFGGGPYLLLVNTSGSSVNVEVPSAVVGKLYVSSAGGQGTVSNVALQLAGYETYIITSSVNHIPGSSPAPTIAPTLTPTVAPSPTIAPTVALPLEASPAPTVPVFTQPTAAAPTIVIFSQPSVPASAIIPTFSPEATTTTPTVSYFSVSGIVEVKNPGKLPIEKANLVLSASKYGEQVQELPPTEGIFPFVFGPLVDGVSYTLKVYVKTLDGFIYQQTNTCPQSNLLSRCVLKKSENITLVVDIPISRQVIKTDDTLSKLLQIPPAIVTQLKVLDFHLVRSIFNVQRRLLLLLQRN